MITYIINTAHALYKQSAHRYYLTEPFHDAIEKAAPKIVKDNKHWDNEVSDCGMIFGTRGTFALYLLNPIDKVCKMILIGFNRECITSYGIVTHDGKMFGQYWLTDEAGKIYNDPNLLGAWLNSAMTTLYFIHHCEIETKIIKPKEKHRQYGIKYFNEGKNDLTILDCTWFTQLIRDTPFTVNGHFRWQPCGINHSKRKLIWIDSFEKQGYNRQAKKPIPDEVHG
jgi:hypothetical protein